MVYFDRDDREKYDKRLTVVSAGLSLFFVAELYFDDGQVELEGA